MARWCLAVFRRMVATVVMPARVSRAGRGVIALIAVVNRLRASAGGCRPDASRRAQHAADNGAIAPSEFRAKETADGASNGAPGRGTFRQTAIRKSSACRQQRQAEYGCK